MHQKILIVDDHKRNVQILERLLQNDYEIRTASSGQEALDTVPSFMPDIVLLDIMMPGMDGYETCRRMRQLESLIGTKIVMVSARAMVTERLKGYEAGADDYITKPFDLDELKAKVDVYMRLRSEEDVSHEIADLIESLVRRTESPLTYTRDAMYLLQKDTKLSPESQHLVTITQGCVTSILNAIKEVQTMASINMSTNTITESPLQLNTMLEAVQHNTAWLAQRCGVEVEIAQANNVVVKADEIQINRALLSLLDYLIRGTGRGGKIRIILSNSETTSIKMAIVQTSPEASPPAEDHMIAIRIAESILSQHHGSLMIDQNFDQITGFDVHLPKSLTIGDTRNDQNTLLV